MYYFRIGGINFQESGMNRRKAEINEKVSLFSRNPFYRRDEEKQDSSMKQESCFSIYTKLIFIS